MQRITKSIAFGFISYQLQNGTKLSEKFAASKTVDDIVVAIGKLTFASKEDIQENISILNKEIEEINAQKARPAP